MGTSMMLVRFPDGSIKFGSYQNTADVGLPWLAATSEEARALRSSDGTGRLPTDGETVDVEVFVDYGGGFWGRMKARGGHLTEGARPIDLSRDHPATLTDYHDGTPDWLENTRWAEKGQEKDVKGQANDDAPGLREVADCSPQRTERDPEVAGGDVLPGVADADAKDPILTGTARNWREVQTGPNARKWQLFVGKVPLGLWANKSNTRTIDRMFWRISTATKERSEALCALARLVREITGGERPAPGSEHRYSVSGRVRGESILDAIAVLEKLGWTK